MVPIVERRHPPVAIRKQASWQKVTIRNDVNMLFYTVIEIMVWNSNTLRRTPPNLGNLISRVRRKNDPQYFYTLRRKSWCICTQALNKYYNKHSRLFKNATEPWLLLHSNEKCRTCCYIYCRHYIQFPLIQFSFG